MTMCESALSDLAARLAGSDATLVDAARKLRGCAGRKVRGGC